MLRPGLFHNNETVVIAYGVGCDIDEISATVSCVLQLYIFIVISPFAAIAVVADNQFEADCAPAVASRGSVSA